MARLTRRHVVAFAAAALVAVPAAGAAAPDLSQVALRSTDFTGAQVASQGTVRVKEYLAGYQRSFTFAKPSGRAAIVFVQSEVELAPTAARATSDFAALEKQLRSAKGRALFAAGVASGAGKTVKPKDVKLGALRAPHVGDRTIEIPVSIKLKAGTVHETAAFMRIDRVVSTLVVASVRTLAGGDSARLSGLVASHATEVMVPAVVTGPTVAGTAAQGQTLTAAPGTWTNEPTFTYQWQRCDAAGANCVDIAGATAPSYGVTAADAGATLRVVLTAHNRFGAPTAQSVVTAVVT